MNGQKDREAEHQTDEHSYRQSMCLAIILTCLNKYKSYLLQMYGQTDGRTDRWTNGQTYIPEENSGYNRGSSLQGGVRG